MIELQTKDQERVLEVVRNFEAADVSPLLILRVGNEDFSDRIPDGNVKHDGIAITLEATFAGNLPLRLYGAPISLIASIDGIEVPLLTGLVSLPEPNDDDVSTKVVAASVGSIADKYTLNERIEYAGESPRFVAQDALRRLPYRHDRIEVENVDSPPLYFATGNTEGPFEKDQSVNDILSKVAEKVPFVFRDTAWGGHKAFVSTGLATIPVVPDHLQFRAEELLFWKSPALMLAQYSQVIVHRENPDGSDAFDPVVANVVYTDRDFPPPVGSTLRIAFTKDQDAALKLAYNKVKELGRGLYKSEPILSFSPLLERTDAFTVAETKDEDGVLYERLWLHYVDAYEHDWGSGGASGGGSSGSGDGFATKPTCSVTLLDEEKIKAPALILGLIASGGILQTPPLPIYSDASGVRYEPSTAVNAAHEPWIGLDSTGAWIDESLAGEYAGVDSQGFWLDFS